MESHPWGSKTMQKMYKPFQFEMDDVLSLKNGSIITHQKDMNSLLYI